MLETSKNQRTTNTGLDVATELTNENHLREIRDGIEKSSTLHIEFWSQLSEDTPDLRAILDMGTKTQMLDNALTENWKKLINQNIDLPPNLLMIYSQYLLDILHDKQAAEDVLELLKKNYQNNIDRGKITNNVNDFPNESTPLISISGEDVSFVYE